MIVVRSSSMGSLTGFCFGYAPRWYSLAPLFSCFSPSAVLFGITLLRVFPIPRRPVDPLPNSTSAPHPHSREAQSGPPPFAGTLTRRSSRHYTPRSIYTVSLACDMPPARRSALHRLGLESALEIMVGLPFRWDVPSCRSGVPRGACMACAEIRDVDGLSQARPVRCRDEFAYGCGRG